MAWDEINAKHLKPKKNLGNLTHAACSGYPNCDDDPDGCILWVNDDYTKDKKKKEKKDKEKNK